VVKDESVWWTSLLQSPTLSIMDVHSMPEHSIVTVSGILGHMCMEEKKVRSEIRWLLIIMILDRTGQIEIRSWTHTIADFSIYREKPILLKRVRVTAYAGTKMIELIDGGGTVVENQFPHAADLSSFWKEPALSL
jgi:hypothetical protein